MTLRDRFFMAIFIWAGNKLFSVVSVYSPDTENVLAVHFARDEKTLRQSLQDYIGEGWKDI